MANGPNIFQMLRFLSNYTLDLLAQYMLSSCVCVCVCVCVRACVRACVCVMCAAR